MIARQYGRSHCEVARSCGMSKRSSSTSKSGPNLFATPLVLEGEDAAAYDELLDRMYAAVGPIDFIDRIFVNDVVCLQWEILRLRRLKTSLIRSIGSEALKKFLAALARLRSVQSRF
jgi:hypothetical protein